MRLAVVTIRPEPGCSATIAAGRADGLAIEGWPLFSVHPLEWQAPDPDEVDALLIGSANAIRHGGAELARLRTRPVYAVGEVTADAARTAGFTVAASGHGGLQELLNSRAEPSLRLLRLAGARHVTLRPPAGISIMTRIVYDSAALPMPEALARRLSAEALVLLHSAGAARHLADQCGVIGIDRGRVALATLGPRISEAAGGGWRALRHAPDPSEGALLDLARDMCHELVGD